ncbi:hypothetical protein Hanom_Chr03g00239031 [Helianthus anomalus]
MVLAWKPLQAGNTRPGKQIGWGQVGSWVKSGSGQNMSIKKVFFFCSGQNGFGSEWVRFRTGFRSERVSDRVGYKYFHLAFLFGLKRYRSKWCTFRNGTG